MSWRMALKFQGLFCVFHVDYRQPGLLQAQAVESTHGQTIKGRSHWWGRKKAPQGGAPQVIRWFINPMKTILISIRNH